MSKTLQEHSIILLSIQVVIDGFQNVYRSFHIIVDCNQDSVAIKPMLAGPVRGNHGVAVVDNTLYKQYLLLPATAIPPSVGAAVNLLINRPKCPIKSW
jgi:hypothetical protein